MAENFAVFGWELTPEDMSAIDHLDRDARRGPDPDTFNRT
jgi:2,5-diketo-D-gluconate reductase A